MTIPLIAASLMAADGARLADALATFEAAGVDAWHWDIMDGHFVPNLTFGPATVKACRKLTKLEFDVHLMVTDPEIFIDAFCDAGADCLTVHAELGEARVKELMMRIKNKKCRVGIAVNPDTQLGAISDATWRSADRMLIMSVQPGFGGQAFIDVTAKISEATAHYAHLDIRVDGGINVQTAPAVRAAGATSLVSGSGLFAQQNNAQEAVNALRGGAA